MSRPLADTIARMGPSTPTAASKTLLSLHDELNQHYFCQIFDQTSEKSFYAITPGNAEPTKADDVSMTIAVSSVNWCALGAGFRDGALRFQPSGISMSQLL